MAKTQLTLPRLARSLALAALGGVIALGTSPEADAQRRSDRGNRSVIRSVVDHTQRGQVQSRNRGEVRQVRDRSIPRNFRGAGRYETRTERVWVPGYTERVWVPARYEWRYDSCGRRIQVLARAGHYRSVCHPGRYERRTVRVWVQNRPVCEPVQRRGRVTRVGRRRR